MLQKQTDQGICLYFYPDSPRQQFLLASNTISESKFKECCPKWFLKIYII